MQRKMNYSDATGFLQVLSSVLGRGDSPVKKPLKVAYESVNSAIEAQSLKLDENFKNYVKMNSEGEPLVKEGVQQVKTIHDYDFSDEKAFQKESDKLMSEEIEFEIPQVSKDRVVITNHSDVDLETFLEHSSTVSAPTAFFLEEYFIEK